MARGKYATRAAVRTAEQLAQDVERLRLRLAFASEQAAAREAELQEKVQRLQSQLTREVDAVAARRIEEAEAAAATAIRQDRKKYLGRAAEIQGVLEREHVHLPNKAWREIATALQVDLDEWMPEAERAKVRCACCKRRSRS